MRWIGCLMLTMATLLVSTGGCGGLGAASERPVIEARAARGGADAAREVGLVLDDWHAAAAGGGVAGFDRYFAHFAAGGVFMGTDRTERWSVEEFKAYARPHFEKGKAWAFTGHDRHVRVSADGRTAWFDEELSTEKMGTCRGSGVMVQEGGAWKIAHYNLSIPIPNEIADRVIQQIAEHEDGVGSIKVMTFNIRYDNPGDGVNAWEHRRGMVARFLEREGADIVGVQEALAGQLEGMLADRPEYASVGVGRDDGERKGEHAAILYRKNRFVVEESGTFWFSDTPAVAGSRSWGNTITRICTWAKFRERGEAADLAGNGRAFYVFNVHLDHESQASRERSVGLLLERIGSRAGTEPVMVTGDFNAGEKNPAVVRMKQGVERLVGHEGAEEGGRGAFVDTFRVVHPEETRVGTFNGFRGERDGEKIDFVFVGPGVRVIHAAIHRDAEDGRSLSDHFPVSARVRWVN